jgi:flavin-dependent dehydrogenase
MIDVLVVGGGPAGLATAIRCAQAGLQVTVAEPRAAPIDKACGEGLMPAAVERLNDLGVEPAGRPFHGIRYLDASHRADAFFRGGHGLGVRRTALHTALAQRADQLAIPVLPVRVTGFVQHSDRVLAAGVEARYLVAADGLHSLIRRACTLDAPPARHPRYGLRRHYRVAPWSDLVEVYWAPGAEAYVTPVADDLVGVAVLGDVRRARGDSRSDPGDFGDSRGDFDSRLAAFPALRERLAGAEPASSVRGAGPLRQDVRHRVCANVLLVGDAAGYLDALTGEGISVALAQAAALVECLQTGRVGDYEHAWRRVSRKSRVLTGGLLWSRHRSLLAARIVPAAARLPRLFTSIVNHVADA